MKPLQPPGPEFALYGVYHNHEYGGSIYLVWSDHQPSEEEAVTACGMEFEPDRDEWIAIDPVSEAETIQRESAEG